MHRFTMLARHLIALVALAVGLLTFGTASMVTSNVAAPSTPAKGSHSRVVAKSDAGKMISRVKGRTESGRPVIATFTPKKFTANEGALDVTGTLKGHVPGKGKFNKTVTMTVDSVQGTDLDDLGNGAEAGAMRLAANCNVLNLVLGPLDLNLLGLEVHLQQVVLDIVAVSGAGNLLGNLLCAVAGLLDPASPLEGLLTQLTGLLNQILGALGGLGL